jgi:RHS repeat-associated protein
VADAPDNRPSFGAAPGADVATPQISLPKGGGAIRGIGETFSVNPVTGAAQLSVPIALSPGRTGFTPHLALAYDSTSGNGPFGMGWTLSLPSITRRTDRGLPRYEDAEESDIYILSGSDDLVRTLAETSPGNWTPDAEARDDYVVTQYRPRVEGLFSIIERWTRQSDSDTYWRSISKDNVTTYYGQTAASRIADPQDPTRVFSWLIDQTQDDTGNAMVYEYTPENSANVDLTQSTERNRTDLTRAANQYIKRIKYGNTPSLLTTPLAELTWLFEVVFDYGEGQYAAEPPNADGQVFATAVLNPTTPWAVRPDPFSRYRATFEIRTYRLCQRVLMFHHFEPELGVPDYLAHATEFTYQLGPIASFMSAVTQSGFVQQTDGTYLVCSLPSVECAYSAAAVQRDVRDVDPTSLENLPSSVDNPAYRWLDLDGEGLQCVLATQGDAWYYKRNLTPLSLLATAGPPSPTAQFETLTDVSHLPALAEHAAPRHEFMDLTGDGCLDCVVLDRPGPGFYARGNACWRPFTNLWSAPTVEWRDPNLRLIDVGGDGYADILITEQDTLTYYPSLAAVGFDAPQRIPKATNEECGPAVIFADPTQSIFLADMSGDGLADIVRVRNGEVCYWPNLGYGLFGTKVDMDQAPWFDAPDQFEQRRLRLADVDGSGVTDIIYLGADGVQLYFNQSGNAWSAPEQVMNYPPTDTLASIQVLDLMGNGTSCLVWTSPLSGDVGRTMRYIDLMGAQKPYLLTGTSNNLGAETALTYAPSTGFSLADRAAGQPWITRLPFPVSVVQRIDIYDWVSRTHGATCYAYHHGYYDRIEREFRGFGMVEQWDTEAIGVLTATGVMPDPTNIDAASYVPPVLTKSWFHTGVYPAGPRLSRIYDTEYYQEPGLDAAQREAMRLPDSTLPADVTGNEIHEALRSLKGMMLRQETYAADGTAAAGMPYTVAEYNYDMDRLQPFGPNLHAVFFPHPRESVTFAYERQQYAVSGGTYADPRVTHRLSLAIDAYGNELQSASAAYGRRYPDPDPLLTVGDRAVQSALLVTYTEHTYTNAILDPDAYRAPQPAETCTYELVNVTPVASMANVTNLFAFDEMAGDIAQAADGLHDLLYEDWQATGATTSHPYRRLIADARTLYRADDLSAGLALGTLESMAFPFVSYTLALTPDLIALYQRGTEHLLPTPATLLEPGPGYALGDDLQAAGLFPTTDPSGNWWAPSGTVFYSPSASDTPAQELAQGTAHFFRGRRYRDPFGNDAVVTYDAPYDLLVGTVLDAVTNTVTAANDYRVLSPSVVTDANGNRCAAAYDGLGLVVATAVMGKTTESLGDSLVGVVADPIQADIDAFFAAPAGPMAATLLGDATARYVYDVGRYSRLPATPSPSYAAVVARETHVSDLGTGQTSALQVSLRYSDGFGREIQRKVQAEPGPLVPSGPVVDPRWVGTGWTIFNNKGKPVRTYEPFFDDTADFAYGVTVGVSNTLFYDPVGRAPATLRPNGTWEKVVFDPWRQDRWDVNDTVLVTDPSTDADVGDYFQRIPSTDYLPTWYTQRIGGALGPEELDAATKAAASANTPSTIHVNPMGRTFLKLTYNRVTSGGSTIETHDRTVDALDIQGQPRIATDALNRVMATFDYAMSGGAIRQTSIDAGTRWLVSDVTGKAAIGWDSRAHRLRHFYDAIRRPTDLWVQTGTSPDVLAERTVYGEGQPNDQALNLRAHAYQAFDGAGVVTNTQFDYTSNLLATTRQLLIDYADPVDWSLTPAPALTSDVFTKSSTFDALNRVVAAVAPDASVIRPTYDVASRLAQLSVNLQGASTATAFVSAIAYDAKGQRMSIAYANGASTTYSYDPFTFRLVTLTTTRAADGTILQNLAYTYDPVGNVTHIVDTAQETIFFSNAVVDPSTDYTYDALYRLVQATGRELIGLASQPQTTYSDIPRMQQPLPSDGSAMRTYTESYQYDVVDNLIVLTHGAGAGSWTRTYAYDQPNIPPTTNHLTSTVVGATTDTYTYDAHGNITAMPQCPVMTWDFKDELQSVQQQVVNRGQGQHTDYVYDATGQRARKVSVSAGGAMVNQRIYLGGFEVYREYGGAGTVTLERTTLHVMDDTSRVALVDTVTVGPSVGTSAGTGAGAATIRYQYANHIGSSCLELDPSAAIISYEEYYPFGSTSFQSGPNSAEVSLKRYRYTGKERDDESGFYYNVSRYYAPWLGRWTSCDPAGFVDGPSAYVYARDNPVGLTDPGGTQSGTPDAQDQQLNQSASTGDASPSFDAFRDRTQRQIAESFPHLQSSGLPQSVGNVTPDAPKEEPFDRRKKLFDDMVLPTMSTAPAPRPSSTEFMFQIDPKNGYQLQLLQTFRAGPVEAGPLLTWATPANQASFGAGSAAALFARVGTEGHEYQRESDGPPELRMYRRQVAAGVIPTLSLTALPNASGDLKPFVTGKVMGSVQSGDLPLADGSPKGWTYNIVANPFVGGGAIPLVNGTTATGATTEGFGMSFSVKSPEKDPDSKADAGKASFGAGLEAFYTHTSGQNGASTVLANRLDVGVSVSAMGFGTPNVTLDVTYSHEWYTETAGSGAPVQLPSADQWNLRLGVGFFTPW